MSAKENWDSFIWEQIAKQKYAIRRTKKLQLWNMNQIDEKSADNSTSRQHQSYTNRQLLSVSRSERNSMNFRVIAIVLPQEMYHITLNVTAFKIINNARKNAYVILWLLFFILFLFSTFQIVLGPLTYISPFSGMSNNTIMQPILHWLMCDVAAKSPSSSQTFSASISFVLKAFCQV